MIRRFVQIALTLNKKLMKNYSKITKVTATVIAVCTVLSLLTTACKKKSSGEKANAKFVGTWHGTESCSVFGVSGPAGDFISVLTAGSSDNSLTTQQAVGSDSTCLTLMTINLTVSGNNLTIPLQTFTDPCGSSWSISGNGTLNGS